MRVRWKRCLREVDGCVLAAPTGLHYDLGRHVLEAGKHLLIEKPITETVGQAKELIHLAQKKELVLHVGHVERFNGAVQELQKTIKQPLLWESRRLGSLRSVREKLMQELAWTY